MLYSKIMPLAQVIVETEPDLEAVQDASFVFNGPQFFASLVAGVVLAFAFQLLLTNLGVAAGISMAGGNSNSNSSGPNPDNLQNLEGQTIYDVGDEISHSSHGLGGTLKKIGMAVGLGTLISVTISLFIASLLAVKLGLYVAPLSGAIIGLVIWAAFFALMMFFSSRTIGSLLGSVANTATSGMQAILGTATAAVGAGAASKQVVNTAEAAAAAVRKELGMAIDPMSMRENVEEFLQSIKPAGIDLNKITKDFEELLDDENLQEIVNSDSLSSVDRNTFIQLVSDRSDLSKKDAERIADKLDSVWKKSISKLKPANDPIGEFTNYVKTATREQLTGTDFGEKIDSLISEIGKNRRSQIEQSFNEGCNFFRCEFVS